MNAEQKIEKLTKALEPFAAMDREGTVEKNRYVCQRGITSDMTIVTCEDFRSANEALKEVKE